MIAFLNIPLDFVRNQRNQMIRNFQLLMTAVEHRTFVLFDDSRWNLSKVKLRRDAHSINNTCAECTLHACTRRPCQNQNHIRSLRLSLLRRCHSTSGNLTQPSLFISSYGFDCHPSAARQLTGQLDYNCPSLHALSGN